MTKSTVCLRSWTVSQSRALPFLSHELINAGMTASRDVLQRKNDELAEAFRDKSRKLFQTQELYTKVKRKAELGQIERAASDAVDSSIRPVPQPAMNSQETHAFLPPHFHENNERSYPLSHGLRFDTTGFTTSPSGLNPQQHEHGGHWPRKRTPSHGEACLIYIQILALTHHYYYRPNTRSSAIPPTRKRPRTDGYFSPQYRQQHRVG